MFLPYKVILRPSKKTNPNNSWICLLGRPEDDLIRSKYVALTKYIIFVNKSKQVLDLSSWRAWGWPYKVEICCSDKIYYFCRQIQTTLGCLLGGPEDNLTSSKHVALTKYIIFVNKSKQVLDLSSWRAWGWPYKFEICRSDKGYYFCRQMKTTLRSVFLEGLRMTL